MSRRSMVARLVAIGVAGALAAGTSACDDGRPEGAAQDASAFDPNEGVDPGAPVEAGELPEEGWIVLTELDDDDRGLELGEEHVVGDNHTTIHEVRRPLPRSAGAPGPGAGREWVGVRVETCFETELDRQLEIGSYMFSAVTADWYAFPGVQPRDPRWPLPQYPGYGRLAAGQCTSGWVAIPVPVGTELTSAVQSSVTKEPVSEWVVPEGAW